VREKSQKEIDQAIEDASSHNPELRSELERLGKLAKTAGGPLTAMAFKYLARQAAHSTNPGKKPLLSRTNGIVFWAAWATFLLVMAGVYLYLLFQ